MTSNRILFALLAFLVAGACWPSPAAAQFGFPGGVHITIPMGPGIMFGPPGAYGHRGYSHSNGSARHRSRERDEDNSASSGGTKDDPSKVDSKTKAAADHPATDAATNGGVSYNSTVAVSSEAAPKPSPVLATDAGPPVEVNPALYEHAPDLTPER